jgi:hypothetical protein
LALCLFGDDDYTEVATKVTGSLDRWNCWNAVWSVPTSSAITQDPGGEFVRRPVVDVLGGSGGWFGAGRGVGRSSRRPGG